MTNRWNRLVLAVLAVGVIGLPANPVIALVLYSTGFERPTFAPGLLEGQDAWFAQDGISVNAATISTDLARSGSQSLRLDAANLENFPGIGSVGFSVRNVSFAPLASGSQFVNLSADINVTGPIAACSVASPLGAPNSCAIGLALDGPGLLPFGVITLNIGGGFVVARNVDGIAAPGPTYNFGEWANVVASYDFENEVVRGFFNGVQFGEVPFTAGVDDTIIAIDIGLGVLTPTPVTGLIVHIDNLSVTAIPEPPMFALLALGLFWGYWLATRCGAYERPVFAGMARLFAVLEEVEASGRLPPRRGA